MIKEEKISTCYFTISYNAFSKVITWIHDQGGSTKIKYLFFFIRQKKNFKQLQIVLTYVFIFWISHGVVLIKFKGINLGSAANYQTLR